MEWNVIFGKNEHNSKYWPRFTTFEFYQLSTVVGMTRMSFLNIVIRVDSVCSL